jgi:hypothetical protein
MDQNGRARLYRLYKSGAIASHPDLILTAETLRLPFTEISSQWS